MAILGIIHNNPGNVKQVPTKWEGSIGEDAKGHTIFGQIVYGLRCKHRNLFSTLKKVKTKTLLGFLEVYAPKSDGNDPLNYAKFVAGKMGISINDEIKLFDSKGRILDETKLYELEIAMFSMELINGWAISETDWDNSILLYNHDFVK